MRVGKVWKTFMQGSKGESSSQSSKDVPICLLNHYALEYERVSLNQITYESVRARLQKA